MSWTAPPTFAGVMDAADFQIIADDLRYLHSPPACSVTHNANQNVASSSSVPTALAMAVEEYDTDGMHSPSVNNSRVTIQTAGRFLVTGTGTFELALDVGGRSVALRQGGSTNVAVKALPRSPLLAIPVALSPHTIHQFTAAQYLELVLLQNSGGTLVAPVGSTQFGFTYIQRLAAHWLGA